MYQLSFTPKRARHKSSVPIACAMLIGIMQFPGYSDYMIFLGEHREPLRETLWFHIVPLFFIKSLTVPSDAGYKAKIP